MSSDKHENSETILEQGYEPNDIGLKGIFGFAIGLFLLIVVTFALMYAFLNVLKNNNKENAGPVNPMQQSDKDRLPPEPRLQAAPGFGVESDHGRVNLELGAPQAEYNELRKQWEHVWEHGRKDEKTGMVTTMPIDEAKEKFLSQNAKAKSGADVEDFFKNSTGYISDSSAGRLASEKRR